MLLVSIGNVSRWPSLKAARNTRLRTDVISRFKYFSDALRVYESFFFNEIKFHYLCQEEAVQMRVNYRIIVEKFTAF